MKHIARTCWRFAYRIGDTCDAHQTLTAISMPFILRVLVLPLSAVPRSCRCCFLILRTVAHLLPLYLPLDTALRFVA